MSGIRLGNERKFVSLDSTDGVYCVVSVSGWTSPTAKRVELEGHKWM